MEISTEMNQKFCRCGRSHADADAVVTVPPLILQARKVKIYTDKRLWFELSFCFVDTSNRSVRQQDYQGLLRTDVRVEAVSVTLLQHVAYICRPK